MKKLFCFLGTGRYLETMYQNADFVMASKFTQEYLINYYATIKQDPFGEIVVFATEESKVKNGQAFEGILGEMPIKWVYYDESFSEKPWLLFEKIDRHMDPGDSIVFDVTHGFRSIPLISLVSSELALLFNENVNIEAVYYGNFKGEGEMSPFVDLTSILELQEWSNAVRSLKQTGNPSLLIELDAKQKKNHMEVQRMAKNPLSKDLLKMFGLGNAVQKLTKSIAFCRLHDVKESWLLTEAAIDKIESSSSEKSYPYIKIKEQLSFIFDDFQQAKSNADYYGAAMKWCVRYGLYQQSITLMLESVISIFCERFGVKKNSRNNRYAISLLLKYEDIKKDGKSDLAAFVRNLDVAIGKSELKKLDIERIQAIIQENQVFFHDTYNNLNDYRNNFNHAGTNEHVIGEAKLEVFIKEHYQDVIEFEREFALVGAGR